MYCNQWHTIQCVTFVVFERLNMPACSHQRENPAYARVTNRLLCGYGHQNQQCIQCRPNRMYATTYIKQESRYKNTYIHTYIHTYLYNVRFTYQPTTTATTTGVAYRRAFQVFKDCEDIHILYEMLICKVLTGFRVSNLMGSLPSRYC
jgi:hypothetical protein